VSDDDRRTLIRARDECLAWLGVAAVMTAITAALGAPQFALVFAGAGIASGANSYRAARLLRETEGEVGP
jgi:membrane protein implicated in regulation of membrane protease activity